MLTAIAYVGGHSIEGAGDISWCGKDWRSLSKYASSDVFRDEYVVVTPYSGPWTRSISKGPLFSVYEAISI